MARIGSILAGCAAAGVPASGWPALIAHLALAHAPTTTGGAIFDSLWCASPGPVPARGAIEPLDDHAYEPGPRASNTVYYVDGEPVRAWRAFPSLDAGARAWVACVRSRKGAWQALEEGRPLGYLQALASGKDPLFVVDKGDLASLLQDAGILLREANDQGDNTPSDPFGEDDREAPAWAPTPVVPAEVAAGALGARIATVGGHYAGVYLDRLATHTVRTVKRWLAGR